MFGCTSVPYEERDGYVWRFDGPIGTITKIEYTRDIGLRCGGKVVPECVRFVDGECHIFIDHKLSAAERLFYLEHAKRHCAGWTHGRRWR